MRVPKEETRISERAPRRRVRLSPGRLGIAIIQLWTHGDRGCERNSKRSPTMDSVSRTKPMSPSRSGNLRFWAAQGVEPVLRSRFCVHLGSVVSVVTRLWESSFPYRWVRYPDRRGGRRPARCPSTLGEGMAARSGVPNMSTSRYIRDTSRSASQSAASLSIEGSPNSRLRIRLNDSPEDFFDVKRCS